MYEIEYAEDVAIDCAQLRAHIRTRILDRIEVELRYEPAKKTRHKKILMGLIPPWEYEEPVWQLSVDEYRVFYDVDELISRVVVRAIRHKPPHRTTEEIL